ncbi:MotA/TolQ/ExbB proton channel family protein [Poriferisphaera sp. WC338]|uniref:MotA/TolQ/ExbB proton channel family protein n=1 Tax=Poriferisphaera sp. WC338 TaxID=3425129 RepID=UPI003D815D10
MIDSFWAVMGRGGPVMWPLLGLSLVSVTLAFERLWFFTLQNNPGQLARVRQMGRMLRDGDQEKTVALVEQDESVYGAMLRRLLTEKHMNDAGIVDAVESQRRRLERFMPTLSTIITAAPMLGILGTVLGIIESFEVLSLNGTAADPSELSYGIAEALITTAAGLIVSLISLFPYNAFRAQGERTLSRMESLASAGMSSTNEVNAVAASEGDGASKS